jgi:transposase-like protein
VTGFGSEEECRAYLERLRWPDGVRCPRCDADRGISRIESRGQFECDACRYQFSVRAGTILHNSQLPLRTWCLAVDAVAGGLPDLSANQLKRLLGVSYKTAWSVRQRIRAALANESDRLIGALARPGARGQRRSSRGVPSDGPAFSQSRGPAEAQVQGRDDERVQPEGRPAGRGDPRPRLSGDRPGSRRGPRSR